MGALLGTTKDYFLRFNDFNIIRNAIIITSVCYIAIYALLEVIKYKKFEKLEDNSNNIYK